MAIVLSLNEQDRALLLLLNPEQRDGVVLSLLLGEEREMDDQARGVWQMIAKQNRKREKTRNRVANHRERYKERYSNAECNGYSNGYTPLFRLVLYKIGVNNKCGVGTEAVNLPFALYSE